MKVILASLSPRRKELLAKLVPEFDVIPSSYPETPLDLPHGGLAEKHSLEKARDVAKDHPDAVVVGGDVFVVHEGEVLEKPKDEADARRMLELIGGHDVDVYSGVAVVCGKKELVSHDHSQMRFRKMSASEVDMYLAEKAPLGSAGTLNTDGLGVAFLEKISGDFYAIRGLSTRLLLPMLVEVDVPIVPQAL